MSKKDKSLIKESNLIKALNDLEALAKGDAMENQDPEGGLATEGKPLSAMAPRGKDRSMTKKSKTRAASSSSAMSSSVEKAEADDDSASSEDMSGDDESSDEDMSSDDESSDDNMSKSFRQRAEENEEMAKGLLVSPFLEAMTDQMNEALSDLSKSFQKSLDNRFNAQNEFNTRIAKGIVLIGRTMSAIVPLVKEQSEMIKSFGNSPNVAQRKSILNKSEIAEPHRTGDDGDSDGAPKLSRNDMQDWLVEKSTKGEIPVAIVTTWETSGHALSSLPLQIRKAMMNDLAKAQ